MIRAFFISFLRCHLFYSWVSSKELLMACIFILMHGLYCPVLCMFLYFLLKTEPFIYAAILDTTSQSPLLSPRSCCYLLSKLLDWLSIVYFPTVFSFWCHLPEGTAWVCAQSLWQSGLRQHPWLCLLELPANLKLLAGLPPWFHGLLFPSTRCKFIAFCVWQHIGA